MVMGGKLCSECCKFFYILIMVKKTLKSMKFRDFHTYSILLQFLSEQNVFIYYLSDR